ncbi:isoprenyl transferase [Eubacteriaceae bacterium ES2]|nr:isoprenyl transferase [Eubacteriaceae bacterium ES2]
MTIQRQNLPEHIAIIMDGNGRWAKKRNRPRLFGHNAGMKTLKKIVRASSDFGIKILTVYAFSTENWKRSEDEVSGLMKIAVDYFTNEVKELHENNVKVNVIGDLKRLSPKVADAAQKAMALTQNNTGLIFNVALNYGGRDEIVVAIKALISDGVAADDVTEEMFAKKLYTAGMPDPDLVLRTSGEKRLSNFLLWQMAYSEIFFIDTLWPDFDEAAYRELIEAYQKRNRTYGSA